jgi:hypothetical protein
MTVGTLVIFCGEKYTTDFTYQKNGETVTDLYSTKVYTYADGSIDNEPMGASFYGIPVSELAIVREAGAAAKYYNR